MAVEQRLVFDEVAELYDRVRPRYPEALIAHVVARSGIAPGERVLEIGCGTGIATEPFARRGFRVTALEPGAAMGAVARRRLAGFADVEIRQCTFEDWPLEPEAFALVTSAQAFHWVAPEARFTRTADALRPGGWLAVFANAPDHEPTPLYEGIAEAYRCHAPELLRMTDSRWYAGLDGLLRAAADSARYGPMEQSVFPWSHEYGAAEYLELMRTQSPHRMLPATQRDALHGAIGAAIERHGGRIPVRYEAYLYLARRL